MDREQQIIYSLENGEFVEIYEALDYLDYNEIMNYYNLEDLVASSEIDLGHLIGHFDDDVLKEHYDIWEFALYYDREDLKRIFDKDEYNEWVENQ